MLRIILNSLVEKLWSWSWPISRNQPRSQWNLREGSIVLNFGEHTVMEADVDAWAIVSEVVVNGKWFLLPEINAKVERMWNEDYHKLRW